MAWLFCPLKTCSDKLADQQLVTLKLLSPPPENAESSSNFLALHDWNGSTEPPCQHWIWPCVRRYWLLPWQPVGWLNSKCPLHFCKKKTGRLEKPFGQKLWRRRDLKLMSAKDCCFTANWALWRLRENGRHRALSQRNLRFWVPKMKPGNSAADCQEAIGIFILHLTSAVVSTQLTTLWVTNTDGNFGPCSFSRSNSIPLPILPSKWLKYVHIDYSNTCKVPGATTMYWFLIALC